MGLIDLYLYYGGEPHSDVIHGVTYEGPGKRLEIIQLKKRREISLKKLKKKIMKELDLDCRFYKIKIIYRASCRRLTATQPPIMVMLMHFSLLSRREGV